MRSMGAIGTGTRIITAAIGLTIITGIAPTTIARMARTTGIIHMGTDTGAGIIGRGSLSTSNG